MKFEVKVGFSCLYLKKNATFRIDEEINTTQGFILDLKFPTSGA